MAHADHAAPATRPALEVADILRERGDAYGETHRLSAQQQRVVDALANCRTAALGGFKSQCEHCGAVTIQYASCRNRHCPKCQTLSQMLLRLTGIDITVCGQCGKGTLRQILVLKPQHRTSKYPMKTGPP